MLLTDGDVGVSVEENVTPVERGRVLGVVHMAVGGIDQPPAGLQDGIVRQNGKVQHHLVHLGVTVAPDAEDVLSPGI